MLCIILHLFLGVCECKPRFIRQEEGVCLSEDLKDVGLPDIITEKILDFTNKSAPVTRKHLTVIAESKAVSEAATIA